MSVENSPLQDDDWSTSVMYFRETLQFLSLDAEGQIAAIGGPNAAWELRQDAIDFGGALIESSNDRLGEDVERGIHVLVEALQRLPENSYQGDAAKALSHPQWGNIRGLAQTLLARI
jgi:hypothetical protein